MFRKRGARFIIRLKGDRHLIFKGAPHVTLDLALACPMYYEETVVKVTGGKDEVFTISYGPSRAHTKPLLASPQLRLFDG